MCGPFRLSLSLLGRDHEHLTTFAAHHHGLWYHLLGRNKHLGKLLWVINITYRDTLKPKRPKPNGYVLNYVILTTHSSHIYSMWDFTHTCNPTNLPLTCESASLWASRPLCGPWTSPTHSPLPNGLFTSSARHPWVSRTPSIGTTCQLRTHIHGNPVRPCPWEPRTTPLFSTISNIPLLGFFLFFLLQDFYVWAV